VRISARVDYAVQALLLLAERDPDVISADAMSTAQGLPHGYAEAILNDLRKHGYVASRRGAHGGYHLARPASQVHLGGVVSLFDGPFVTVRATPAADLTYRGPARHLPSLWTLLDERLHGMLDTVTLDDLLHGRMPA